jgi:hypothetical protein
VGIGKVDLQFVSFSLPLCGNLIHSSGGRAGRGSGQKGKLEI